MLGAPAKVLPRSITRTHDNLLVLLRTLGLCDLFMTRFGTIFQLISPCKCRFDHRETKRVASGPKSSLCDWDPPWRGLPIAGSRSVTSLNGLTLVPQLPSPQQAPRQKLSCRWPKALPTRMEPACWSRLRCPLLPQMGLHSVQEQLCLRVSDPSIFFVFDVVEVPHASGTASTPLPQTLLALLPQPSSVRAANFKTWDRHTAQQVEPLARITTAKPSRHLQCDVLL